MARYSLLNPWPREALQFAAALERAGRCLQAARRGLSANWELTVPEWRLLSAIRQGGCEHPLSIAALGERSLGTLESTMRALLLEMTNDLSLHTLEIMTEALTRLSSRVRSCRSILQAANRRYTRRGQVRKIRQPS